MSEPKTIKAYGSQLNVTMLHFLATSHIPRFRMHPAQQMALETLGFLSDKTPHQTIQESLRILSLPVIVDPSLPKGTIRLEDINGQILGEIVGLDVGSYEW